METHFSGGLGMRWFLSLFFVLYANHLHATTYAYVGQPFTDFTNQILDFGSLAGSCDANSCTNITGFVTFNFDTSHFSGALQLADGDTANLSGGVPVSLSGAIISTSDFPFPSTTIWFNPPINNYGYTSGLIGNFTLSSGSIISWALGGSAGAVGCGGGPGCAEGGASVSTSPTSDISFINGYLSTVGGSNAGGGVWLQEQIAGVPEPSTWAMLLIGFAAIGLAGYRKSRREIFT